MFDSSSDLDFAIVHQDPTHGFQSLMDAGLDPSEILMRKEEGEAAEVEVDRAMVFRRLLVFCHMGTLDPVAWAERAMAIARHAAPAMVCRMVLVEWDARCEELGELARPGVAALEARRMGRASSVAQAQGLMHGYASLAEVLPDGVGEDWLAVVRGICGDLFSEGFDPERVAKRLAAYTMVFFPRLLVGASCEDIGAVFDQCRAAVSWRVRQVFNERVEGNGGVAHAAFQKSASVVAKYSQAQMGNRNRRKTQDNKTQDTRL